MYLTLAQQYHYFHQINDDEGCQVIGRQIAEKILPYAQYNDTRLLCFVPREILSQYDIEYE